MASDYDAAGSILLASILKGETEVANRMTLGPTVPIQMFQALRLIALGSAMEDMVGDGARALIYQSGMKLGGVLGAAVLPAAEGELGKYVDLIGGVCKQLAIGVLVAEKVDLDNGELTLRVDECVSCAGITKMSAPICNFEAGLIGGVVKTFLNHPVKAIETRCNAIGDKTCGVEVKVL